MRFALVGLGGMGLDNLVKETHFNHKKPETYKFTYSYAGAILKLGHEIAAMVDVGEQPPEGVRLLREQFSINPSYYDKWDKMLEDVKPDVVCVAASPEANVDIIPGALEQGVRAIWCEKPFTHTLAEADVLIAKAKKYPNCVAAVNYMRNFDPFHNAVIEHIKTGGIGNLQSARITYNGGLLLNAVHGVALINLLLDRPLVAVGAYSPTHNINVLGRPLDDPNVDGIVRYHFEAQRRDVPVLFNATGRGAEENNLYQFELEFTGSEARISILHNGWTLRYERMKHSKIFGGSIGEKHPYFVAEVSVCPPSTIGEMPLELRETLKVDAPREYITDGLQCILSAVDSKTTVPASLSHARAAEEVVHGLALTAERRAPVHFPLEGADRMHRLASKGGMKLMKTQYSPPA